MSKINKNTINDLNSTKYSGKEITFESTLAKHGWDCLKPAKLEIFQINLGKLCNMSCKHCHVDAGPERSDAVMSRETADHCLNALDLTECHTVDLTGGAPELNPNFKYLVDNSIKRGKHVIDRCNLTILLLKDFEFLPDWLAQRKVEIVCSLPHYRRRSTDALRGNGVHELSIKAIKKLNDAGYGKGDKNRILTIMSNPAGAFLSPDQGTIEKEWKSTLIEEYGVSFDRLITLNNMPIARYLKWLTESGNFDNYMERLIKEFNPATIEGLMCRNTISVSWDGKVYDCDFNQMLGLQSEECFEVFNIKNLNMKKFMKRRIKTAGHCFGCSAGCGSSCSGQTAG